MLDYVMYIFHQEKIGLNPLRGFFSPYTRNIDPHVRYATLPYTHVYYFFLVKDIHDVIKHAKFGDDRLRGSGVVAGQISAFPIDFAGRPYNTLTLPCERVI